MDIIYHLSQILQCTSNLITSSRPSTEETEQNKMKQQHENLLQYMIDVEKQRKMRDLKGCKLMEKLNVPDDLLRIIAHPLSW